MNKKLLLFWVCFAAYVMLLASKVTGAPNRPYVNADSITVSTTAMTHFSGLLTNDSQTQVTAQTVFDAIDDLQLPTASNVTVNTNGFTVIAQSNNTVQDSLNWINSRWPTNVSNTNTYPTWLQASNSFLPTNYALDFIPASGAGVSNKHMAANAVLGSNLSPNVVGGRELAAGFIAASNLNNSYMSMLRLVQYDFSTQLVSQSSTNIISPTQYTPKSRLFTLRLYLDATTAVTNRANLLYVYVDVSTNGTTWTRWAESYAMVAQFGALAMSEQISTPALLTWIVPAGFYVQSYVSPGSSLSGSYTARWALLQSLPD